MKKSLIVGKIKPSIKLTENTNQSNKAARFLCIYSLGAIIGSKLFRIYSVKILSGLHNQQE